MKKALLLLTCLLLAGCGGRRVKSHIPNTALLVAYFDMKDAPAHLEWAAVNQVGNPQSWYLRVDDGLVYAENLPAGAYYLSSFGGGDDTNCLVRRCCFGGSHVQMSFNIPEDSALAIVKVKPGVNFMGSYRFVRESKTKTGAVFKGMFASGGARFDLVPIDLPAEREVLQRLVHWIRDTGWEPVVRDRLDRMHLEAGIIREPQADLISSGYREPHVALNSYVSLDEPPPFVATSTPIIECRMMRHGWSEALVDRHPHRLREFDPGDAMGVRSGAEKSGTWLFVPALPVPRVSLMNVTEE